MTDPISQLQVGENAQTNAQATNDVRNEVVITIEGQDTRIPMDSMGLTINSPESEILRAVRPIMREQRGLDISDDRGEISYTVRKAMNSNTIYVYPKPVAG